MIEIASFPQSLPTLETERLLLRDVQPADARVIYAYSSHPVFHRCMGQKTPASVDAFKAKIEKSLSTSFHTMPRNWVVILKTEQRIIGDCGFNVYRPDNRRAEINYAIDPAYWNRGLATEAVNAVIQFGFEVQDLNRIQAICTPANGQSQRVIEKAGLVYEGLLRHYIWFESGPLDMKIYSILKNEWQNA